MIAWHEVLVGDELPKRAVISNVSQTVYVDIISVYTMRVTVSCCVYIYSMLSEPRILFPWQYTGVTVSENKCSFHIQCCLTL